jgi:hypothetical protein
VLGITDNLGDAAFSGGQFAKLDAANLKDDASVWQSQFNGTSIHGVILIGSNVGTNIQDNFNAAIQALGNSVLVVY